MITSGCCRWPGAASSEHVRKLHPEVQRAAHRKLRQLDVVDALCELAVPPGNRLETPPGDRTGQHSIRINDQWRIYVEWTDAGPRPRNTARSNMVSYR